MEVYLDNAATTKPFTEVIELMNEALSVYYGNPSSLHNKGIEAEKKIKKAKEIIANILKVEKKELYFTSGGTESNNLALLGVARAYNRTGKHIITSSIEHPSVLNTLLALEDDGYEITVLPVNEQGLIDIDILKNTLRKDTILVSLMHVNNEVGTIQPLDIIGKAIKEINKKTIFHVDAIQSFGKLLIYPKKMAIDLLSISGHKLHGPKGIGALYVSNAVKLRPMIYGGNQQKGLRSGTENVPAIVGLGCASQKMHDKIKKNTEYIFGLKLYFFKSLVDSLEGIVINGMEMNKGAVHILNVRFDNIKSEILLHSLESKGIYVSTGSACSATKSSKSTTLKAMGLSSKEIDNSIRFSFSVYNTIEQLDYCVKELVEIVIKLRKFTH